MVRGRCESLERAITEGILQEVTVAKTKPSRLARELVETAEGMHRLGMMDRATFEKITLRHLGPKNTPKVRHRRRAPAARQ